MKARTLCFFAMIAVFFLSLTATAAGPDFNALIDEARKESEAAHAETVKAAPESENVSFYNNDWLNLRHRKRIALAQADIKLKKNVPSRRQPASQ